MSNRERDGGGKDREARARLVFLGDPPAVHQLSRTTTIGRHPGNDIQVLDSKISKEHCIIEQRGDHFILRDAGSMNGTYLNGAIVAREARLKHLDIIRMGHACARFDDLKALSRVEAPLSSSSASLSIAPGPRGFADLSSAPDEGTPASRWMASPRSVGVPSAKAPFWARPAPATTPHNRDLPLQGRAGSAGADIAAAHALQLKRQASLHHLMESRDVATAAERTLETVCAALSADTGATFLLDAQGEPLERAVRGASREVAALLVSRGALAHVVERRAVVVTLGAEVPSDGAPAAARRSAVGVPIRYGNRVLGIVWVETPQPLDVTALDLDFADLVGKQAGLLLAVIEREALAGRIAEVASLIQDEDDDDPPPSPRRRQTLPSNFGR